MDPDSEQKSDSTASTREQTDSISVVRKISKYDAVKVKVWLEDHFFIFSRFLISRILTLNKVPPKDSIRIAMDLKKLLVEEGKLELRQPEMENYLFRIMRVYNYGDAFIRRYQMMNRFYSLRAPLLILVSGPPICGKSTLVTQLADRVNVANVLQTAIVTSVMNRFNAQGTQPPFWAAHESRIDLYKAECQSARKGVQTDIIKCLREGKSLIIEGYHIDPTLYFRPLEEAPHRKFRVIWPDNPAFAQDEASRNDLESINFSGAVIVPFLLTISEKDHAYIVENWLMSSLHPSVREELNRLGSFQMQLQHALRSFQEVQRYLLDFDELFTVLPINIEHIEETINTMHNVILARIEAAYGQ